MLPSIHQSSTYKENEKGHSRREAWCEYLSTLAMEDPLRIGILLNFIYILLYVVVIIYRITVVALEQTKLSIISTVISINNYKDSIIIIKIHVAQEMYKASPVFVFPC